MKYISIDLETTGLNPTNCQILQFAAVFDDTSQLLGSRPTFNRVIYADKFKGEAVGLVMNQDILRALSSLPGYYPISRQVLTLRGKEAIVTSTHELVDDFYTWLNTLHGFNEKPVQVAGKNFAAFDLPFLLTHTTDWCTLPISHRFIDPGSMYLQPGDTAVPNTTECMRRAGLEGVVTHDALDDALVVCKLIRHKL